MKDSLFLPKRACRTAFLVLLALLIILPGTTGFTGERSRLQQILDSGVLRLVTRNNSNCYYIYREQPRGLEYEIARAFSDYLGVDLVVETCGWNDMFDILDSDQGDFLAAGVTISDYRRKQVDFSQGYLDVQQQIVVHRNNNSIQELDDLKNKKIHVRRGTTYQRRLEELNRDNDLNMEIVLYNDVPTEELIRGVAKELIDITVSDSNIALLNRRYYPDIKVAFPIEEKEALGWAVKKGNHELLAKINTFLTRIKENGRYAEIYERYYNDVHIFDYVDLKRFHRRLETRLPKYSDQIKVQAGKYGLDWKFIAAMAYQESHLNPQARSYTGVKGLMQVTLVTAREMGIRNRLDPEQSIEAGVRYLYKLYQRWDDIEGPDRLLFALASYNTGYGHVSDARRIAVKKGLDPDRWSSLEKTLPLLTLKEYYKDTVYGYARGNETVRYVNRILTYYDILKNKKPSPRYCML